MVERAFQVKDALQLYKEHFRSSGTDRLGNATVYQQTIGKK